MTTIRTTNYTVEYEDTDDLRRQVFEAVLDFYIQLEAFHGEVIQQSDNCIIEAPSVLSGIADDLFKFKVQYPSD